MSRWLGGILEGEMSAIGPRPLPPKHFAGNVLYQMQSQFRKNLVT